MSVTRVDCEKTAGRLVVMVACGLAAVATSSRAAEPTWAEKMFDSTSHDFGVIAVTAKAVSYTHLTLPTNREV